MNLKKIIILLSLLSCLGTGCADDYQQLEEYYYQDRYLEASKVALKGLENKGIRAKIIKFLHQNGDRLIDESLQKYLILSKNTQTDTALVHMSELLEVYITFRNEKIQISKLNHGIDKLKKLIDTTKGIFIHDQLQLGEKAFSSKLYRAADIHYAFALKYDPKDEKVQKMKSKSQTLALKNVIIIPFTDAFSQKSLIHGVDITGELTQMVFDALDNQKSKYLIISIGNETPQSEGDIIINTVLRFDEKGADIPELELKSSYVEYKYLDNGIERWASDEFKYEVQRLFYNFTIDVNSDILSANDNSKEKSIQFTETVAQTFEFQGRIIEKPEGAIEIRYPNEYLTLMEVHFDIDRTVVIRKTLLKVTNRLVKRVLEEIDKD